MDKRTEESYWKARIEEDGIDTVDGILANDRTSPGNDIIHARNNAISSFRKAERASGPIGKYMKMEYILAVIIIGILVLISVM